MIKYPESLRALALLLEGCPYIWGGKKPWPGLDCSGFVNFVLRASANTTQDYGPAHTIATSPAFYNLTAQEPPSLGDVAIYGTSAPAATHVMLHLDADTVIGAHGAGHTCTSAEIAARLRAYVSRAHTLYRTDYLLSRRLL